MTVFRRPSPTTAFGRPSGLRTARNWLRRFSPLRSVRLGARERRAQDVVIRLQRELHAAEGELAERQQHDPVEVAQVSARDDLGTATEAYERAHRAVVQDPRNPDRQAQLRTATQARNLARARADQEVQAERSRSVPRESTFRAWLPSINGFATASFFIAATIGGATLPVTGVDGLIAIGAVGAGAAITNLMAAHSPAPPRGSTAEAQRRVDRARSTLERARSRLETIRDQRAGRAPPGEENNVHWYK
jgi:hypothetical protein